jgi:hypothetical protein
VLDSISSVFQE